MRSHIARSTCCLLAGLLGGGLAPGAALAAPSFQGLGDLAGGSFGSYVSAISTDGTTAVGVGSAPTGLEPFRWTQADGMASLGKLTPSDADESATGVSSDGSVIVGRSGNEAYRWTSGGMVGLGYLPPVVAGEEAVIGNAEGVSGDGSFAVGWDYFNGPCYSGEFGPVCDARFSGFTWTGAGGLAPFSPASAIPRDVSASGAVIVGDGVNGSNLEAFRYDTVGGFALLGRLTGHARSDANAVSADGSTVVGQSSVGSTPWEAFRWTQAGGMQGLGNLNSGTFGGSEALGVSGDGSLVVGTAPSDTGSTAFIWDEAHGMRALTQILIDELGLDLTGWTLTRATDISADGTVIVGWGMNPNGDSESWIAVIPEPSTGWLVAAGLAGLGRLQRTRRASGARSEPQASGVRELALGDHVPSCARRFAQR
jgi:probable HAF family extracellular repeat protein